MTETAIDSVSTFFLYDRPTTPGTKIWQFCYLGDRLEFETRTIRVSPDYVESISRNIPDKLKKRDIIINTNIIVPCLFG